MLAKAQEAGKLTEIKEIEEIARISLMWRQGNEALGGETATIAGVVSDLKAEGYNIKQIVTEPNTVVTNIVLSKNKVKMNKNSEIELTYTFDYGEVAVRYFAEIKGKYYEIIFENGTININTKETNIEIINSEAKITVRSSNEELVKAKLEENDKIILNSLEQLGETNIIVREENNGAVAVCDVRVMTLIQGITFNQETINIEKGDNIELNTLVIINPTDATEELIWTTEDDEIVEITEEGRLVGEKEGTTTIKVTNEDGTIEATCTVKVVISATGISLNKSISTINKGNTDSLTVTLTPADTTDYVTWTSEKTNVATATADATGRTATIRAVGAGTSKITVTCGGQTAYCTVTVKVPATGLTISQTSATVKVGSTLQLTATATPSDTTDAITWRSSNTSVATVSTNGLVTGVKAGTAMITVTCGSHSKTCNVTVSNFTGVNTSITNPDGALPSGNVTVVEADASKGIVIKDKNNREWVWIVVPKSVFTTATSSTQYANIKQDLVTYAGVYRNSPMYTVATHDDVWFSGCGISDQGTYTTYYNKMLKSVYTNGGFWITRSEDRRPNITCDTAQQIASEYAPDNFKTGSLLFGIQWDLVCRYLQGKEGLTEALINSNSTSWGDYNSRKGTQNLDNHKKMNIYDFAGGAWEYTLEKGKSVQGQYWIARGTTFNYNTNGCALCASFRFQTSYTTNSYVAVRGTFY